MGVLLSVLGFAKKVPFWVWLIVAAGGYVWWSQNKIDNLQAEVTRAMLADSGTVKLDSSTYVRLTVDKADKDSLREALATAEELNADLIAAANVVIQRDTVYRDTTVITTQIVGDEERVARIIDTTDVGVLDATIIAPKFPAQLRWMYTFAPAPIEFTASVLRIQDNSAIFAIHTTAGDSVEINAPFARLPAKQKSFVPYIGGFYDLGWRAWGVRGGAKFKLPWINLYAFGELEQMLKSADTDLNTDLRVRTGLTWEFR